MDLPTRRALVDHAKAINELKAEMKNLSKLMEEMANTPKEEFGKRQPGETCGYEIQRK